MKKDLKKFLLEKQTPGNWLNIANQFGVTGTNKQKSDYVRRLWKKERQVDYSNFCQSPDFNSKPLPYVVTTTSSYDPEYQEFLEFKKSKQAKKKLPKPYLKGDPKNVLVIGDKHEPFCMEGYLEFCRFQQERFNCGKVVGIGDVIDSHFSSFHTTDPDGLSAELELSQAVEKLKAWYQVFPEMTVTLGNHDRIIARKLFSVGVSKRWMKPLGEVLETPNWEFVEELVYNGVLYIHGENGQALTKAKQEMCSVVQGHHHTSGYVQLLNGGKNFAMQVGCGLDFEAYAFAYAQRGAKPILSCGVVLDQSPIIIPFHD